jgi:hypothetical protein
VHIEHIEEEQKVKQAQLLQGKKMKKINRLKDQVKSRFKKKKITLRRSTRQIQPPIRLRDYVTHEMMYLIQEFISYDGISNQYKAYLTNISKQIEPVCFDKASKYPTWCKAMEEELQALKKNCTWDVVMLPNKKNL